MTRCIGPRCPCEENEEFSFNCGECIDSNECKTGQHNCQQNEKCINLKHGYECKPLSQTINSTATTMKSASTGVIIWPSCETNSMTGEQQIGEECIDITMCMQGCYNKCLFNSLDGCLLELNDDFLKETQNECQNECNSRCVNEVNECETGQHNCQPNEECINMEPGFQCRPPPTTTLTTNTTATTETNGPTETTGNRATTATPRTTDTYETAKNATASENVSSNQIGVLVGAIVASFIFVSMIFLIIYFYKRSNRVEKTTQTIFRSTEKGSHETQSRISRITQPTYDEPYEEYAAYLSPSYRELTKQCKN